MVSDRFFAFLAGLVATTGFGSAVGREDPLGAGRFFLLFLEREVDISGMGCLARSQETVRSRSKAESGVVFSSTSAI